MEEHEQDNDNVLVFDHFYTNNHIQIMKSLLPYIDNDASSMLPVMIKYMELRYTMELVKHKAQPFAQSLAACSREPADLDSIYRAIRRYLSPDEERGFAQMMNMMNTMSNVRQMQQMMELMQGMGGDENIFSGFGDSSDMDLGSLMELFHAMK